MKVLLRVTRIFDCIVDSLAALGAALIICAVLIVSTDVIGRYFLSYPLKGATETCEYIMVAFTFLSAAWLLKREEHVRVAIVVERLNLRTQTLLGIITSIVGAGLTLVLVIYGSETAWHHKATFRLGTELELLMGPLYAIIPVFSFPLFIQFLRRGYGYLRVWKSLRLKNRGTLKSNL